MNDYDKWLQSEEDWERWWGEYPGEEEPLAFEEYDYYQEGTDGR